MTREDVAAYAEASGDRNPLHLDDAFARSVGFPGLIAHGMFTLGHLASALEAWVGEAGELVSLRAQFRSPVFPGDRIVARGRVLDADARSATARLEVWVEVMRDGEVETPVRRGEATVRVGAGSEATEP